MLFLRRVPKFSEVARELMEIKRTVYAPATVTLATIHITRLTENFGRLRVDRISDFKWAEYLNKERAKRQRKFFDDRKFMRIILHYALENKLITVVPKLRIPDPPGSAGREISAGELAALQMNARPTLRFQIRIAYKMGLRRGEMLRLRWGQIDSAEQVLRLDVLDTKTRRSRVVPIPRDLWPEFMERMAHASSKLLFASPTGPQPQRDNKTAWRRCKAKARVKARWHDLRHTCATNMLRRGTPPHVVKRLLGMSEKVLTQIYAHVDRDDLRKAVEG